MMRYLLLSCLILFVHCAKTEYYLKNVNHKVRLTAFSEQEGYKLKRRFDISHTRLNILWGIIRVYNKDLDGILNDEFQNPEKEAIGNLVLMETYDFSDSLLDFLSLGIVRLYSVKVNGDLYEVISVPKKITEDNLEKPKETKELNQIEQPKLPKEVKPSEPEKKKGKGVKNAK